MSHPISHLYRSLKKRDMKVYYIGSYEGIEKKLIEKMGIPYYGISSGKLADILILRISATHLRY